MKTNTNLIKARLRQTRGSAKETWGNVSNNNRTRMEGRLEKMAGRSQTRLLRTEAQARREIQQAVERGQQNIQKLSESVLATANQALAKPAKKRASWPWIPALGSALLVGLGLAVFSLKSGVLATQTTTEAGGARS